MPKEQEFWMKSGRIEVTFRWSNHENEAINLEFRDYCGADFDIFVTKHVEGNEVIKINATSQFFDGDEDFKAEVLGIVTGVASVGRFTQFHVPCMKVIDPSLVERME